MVSGGVDRSEEGSVDGRDEEGAIGGHGGGAVISSLVGGVGCVGGAVGVGVGAVGVGVGVVGLVGVCGLGLGLSISRLP